VVKARQKIIVGKTGRRREEEGRRRPEGRKK
jgi:hypothetical protein